MIQVASRTPATERGSSRASCFERDVDVVVDRLRLARVAARGEHEEVGVVAHRPHVEDDDVRRQLLLGESGDPAGLLERAQVGLGVLSATRRSVAAVAATAADAVEAEPLDLGRDRRRHEAVERLAREPHARGGRATRSAAARARRGSTRSGRASAATAAASWSAGIPGPRRDAEPRELEHRSGSFQVGKSTQLVGADQEDRVVEAAAPRARRPSGRAAPARPPHPATSAKASRAERRHRRPRARRGACARVDRRP